MTKINPWIDELPVDSPDRALLGAGRAARPPEGSKEAAWRAIALSLGAAATTTALSAQASAALSAKASTAGTAAAAQVAAVKGAVGATGLSMGIKAVTMGFVVGVGLLGAGEVVDRVTSQAPAPSASLGERTPRREVSRRPVLQSPAAHEVSSLDSTAPAAATLEPSVRARGFEGSRAELPQPRRAESSDIGQGEPTAAAPVTSVKDVATHPHQEILPAAGTSALAEQARELARIQRLLDAGSSAEALRQLEANIGSGAQSGLAEERDALYVQALVKAQRTTQATTWARRFIQKYPNSPHLEKMRRVLGNE